MTTGAITQYDLIGKVEDVSDIITNISPAKTPFQAIIGSETITQAIHSWQEDSLIDAADNFNVEGIDAPSAVSNPTTLQTNGTQIYMKTAQATEIINKISASSLSRVQQSSAEKILSIKEKALDNMLEMVSSEELKVTSPFAFWDASRKTAETVSKLDAGPAQVNQTTVSQNIQNNFIASPELLASLRNAPTMTPIEVPANVQYLGSPPAGNATQGVLGSGHSELPNKSKNGLTLVGGSDTLPTN